MMARILALASLASMLALAPQRDVAASEDCEPYIVTAYSAEDYPGVMANGETTRDALARDALVAAGSWNLELGTRVRVDGIGLLEISDRGMLSARHLDLLMPTTAEALAWGVQVREVCRI